jgi:hypothetical protein
MDIQKPNIREQQPRSLSEEFYSRSPNSQMIIKGWTNTTPTSKYKKVIDIKDDATVIKYYKTLDVEQQQLMIYYGMINPKQLYQARFKM